MSLIDTDIRGSGIEPNYIKSRPELYEDAMKKVMAFTSNWSIFNSAEMSESITRTLSWVPDWSNPNPLAIPNSKACGWSEGTADFSVKGLLKKKGTLVDSIHFFEPFEISNGEDNKDIHEIASDIHGSSRVLR